jgi:hypothetical protein
MPGPACPWRPNTLTILPHSRGMGCFKIEIPSSQILKPLTVGYTGPTSTLAVVSHKGTRVRIPPDRYPFSASDLQLAGQSGNTSSNNVHHEFWARISLWSSS